MLIIHQQVEGCLRHCLTGRINQSIRLNVTLRRTGWFNRTIHLPSGTLKSGLNTALILTAVDNAPLNHRIPGFHWLSENSIQRQAD